MQEMNQVEFRGLVIGGPLDGKMLSHYTREYATIQVNAPKLCHSQCSYEYLQISDGGLWVPKGYSLRDAMQVLTTHYHPNRGLKDGEIRELANQVTESLRTMLTGYNLPSWIRQVISEAIVNYLKEKGLKVNNG